MNYFFLFTHYALILRVVEGISSSIPNHLVNCYRSNYLNSYKPPPLTIRLLIELTRKIELIEHDALNLKLFTTSLLHGVRFDGILSTPGIPEGPHLIPYSATGKQFYKYKLIVDYLTSGKPKLIPYNSVSTNELCLFHTIISNTVHVWERGNEGRTCPAYLNNLYLREKYLCPVEGGVVSTNWGTISPGHLVAAIASALQETTLNIKDTFEEIEKQNNVTTATDINTMGLDVNNLFVSTIVGDLAEVVIYQASNKPFIGSSGVWNDTRLPRNFFLESNNYDMTAAELLGGIDGFIIAQRIKSWLAILSRTRFSQLLDMYYSRRGIAYDTNYKACQRNKKITQLLVDTNLTQQTVNVARLLQDLGATNQYRDESTLGKYAEAVIEHFKNIAEAETRKYSGCEQEIVSVQPLEIICILDESYVGYTAETFIGELLESVDLGFYGSTLGIVNGFTGEWMTNVTYSAVQLYEELSLVKSWQTSFRLDKALATIYTYLEKGIKSDCTTIRKARRTTVLLVMVPSARLSEDDLQSSEQAIKSIGISFPDTRIFYVTSSGISESFETFTQLLKGTFIKFSENDKSVVRKIAEICSTVPTAIVDFFCDAPNVTIEDYITPGVTKFYEIRSEYLRYSDFVVKFKGNDYGSANICIFSSLSPNDRTCHELNDNQEVQFDGTGYCLLGNKCSVQFSATATKAKFKCSEIDCRYPDQVRLDILTSWTRKSGSSVIRYNIYMVLLVLAECIRHLNF